MTLNRQILRKIDDKLRSETEEETGEWMAKVPIFGATKTVWQRHCQPAGVHMGQGVAILIHQEPASVVDQDLETLGDLAKERQAKLDEGALAVARAEQQLEHTHHLGPGMRRRPFATETLIEFHLGFGYGHGISSLCRGRSLSLYVDTGRNSSAASLMASAWTEGSV